MQFMGNAAWWDERVALRGDRPLPPDAALVRDMARLKTGSALDIACGDGRNALYLAQNGFRVTGVDFSEKALHRLDAFASAQGLCVETRRMDLCAAEALIQLGRYDTVIINHYRLQKEVISLLPGHLTDGGTVWINGFYGFPQVNARVTEQELLHQADFIGLERVFRIVFKKEYETEQGKFLTLLYQKGESSI